MTELLGHHGELDGTQPEPSIGLWHCQDRPVERHHPVPQVVDLFASAFTTFDDAPSELHGVLATQYVSSGILEIALLVGEVEIHGGTKAPLARVVPRARSDHERIDCDCSRATL